MEMRFVLLQRRGHGPGTFKRARRCRDWRRLGALRPRRSGLRLHASASTALAGACGLPRGVHFRWLDAQGRACCARCAHDAAPASSPTCGPTSSFAAARPSPARATASSPTRVVVRQRRPARRRAVRRRRSPSTASRRPPQRSARWRAGARAHRHVRRAALRARHAPCAVTVDADGAVDESRRDEQRRRSARCAAGRRPSGRVGSADATLSRDHEDRNPSRVRRVARHLHLRQRLHTRSTEPEIHVEICSNCHPFYTGSRSSSTPAAASTASSARQARAAAKS